MLWFFNSRLLWRVGLTALALLFMFPAAARAAVVSVSDAAALRDAIDTAGPGDEIVLAPGTYVFTSRLSCDTPGTPTAPITVRAETLGDAIIEFDTVEGFTVSAPHWTFENLLVQGVCALHSDCEHAFHIVGEADFTTVRGCVLQDFNAQIKGNGEDPGSGRVWPDDVLIDYTEFGNTTVRQTSNPVTPIDVVGGRRWIIRGNFIHDHAKGEGNQISYAAFLKGNSRNGLFERNLVICELLHSGQIRLGLSFGGGGSSPDPICEDGDCSIEHQDGIMRNNIIVNCPTDVGIYVNEGLNVQLYNNTLYNTTGIDVRFGVTVADVRNNLCNGQIRSRDGATLTEGNNVQGAGLADFQAWFADPDNADFTLVDGAGFVNLGAGLTEVFDDFCANDRDDGQTDIGAVEYDGDGPCDTTRPHVGGSGQNDGGSGPGPDSGGPGPDSGGPGPDSSGPGPDSSIDPSGQGDDGCSCAQTGQGIPMGLLVWLLLIGLGIGIVQRENDHATPER